MSIYSTTDRHNENLIAPSINLKQYTETIRQVSKTTLRQQVNRHRLLMEMSQRIRQSLDLQEILQTTVDEVRQFLQTDRVLMFQFEPDFSGTVAVESVGAEWMPILASRIYIDWELRA